MTRTKQNSHLSNLAGRKLLLLCSGGIDSIVMAHQVANMHHKLSPKSIAILHLDHGYRTGTIEAKAEVEAAAAIAAQYDIPFYFIKRDAKTDPTNPKLSKQDSARQWRYRIATLLAESLDCDYILTGHNASDNTENALLHLAGIIPSPAMLMEASLADTEVKIYRPLLSTTRPDIEAYAKAHEIIWAEDPTNCDATAYQRNNIRHNVVPALTQMNPNIGSVLSKNAFIVADMKVANREMAEIMLKSIKINDKQLNLIKLTPHSLPVQRAIITAWLTELKPEKRGFNHRTVENVVHIANSVNGKRVSLSDDVIIENHQRKILLVR